MIERKPAQCTCLMPLYLYSDGDICSTHLVGILVAFQHRFEPGSFKLTAPQLGESARAAPDPAVSKASRVRSTSQQASPATTMYSLLRALPRAVSRGPLTLPKAQITPRLVSAAQRPFSMCSRLAFPGAAEKPKRKTASATAKKAGTTTKKAGTATKKKGTTTKKTAAKKAAPKKPGPKPKAPVKKVPCTYSFTSTVVENPSHSFMGVEIVKITSDMLPPKQPLSPFFRFSAELRKTQPKSASRDEASTNAKEAGRLWNELPEEEKRVCPFTGLGCTSYSLAPVRCSRTERQPPPMRHSTNSSC